MPSLYCRVVPVLLSCLLGLSLQAQPHREWLRHWPEGDSLSGRESAFSTLCAPDGGVIVGGVKQAGGTVLVKYSPSGAILWSMSLSAGVPGLMWLDSEGNLYINASGLVRKFSTSGVLLWQSSMPDDVFPKGWDPDSELAPPIDMDSTGAVYFPVLVRREVWNNGWYWQDSPGIAKVGNDGQTKWVLHANTWFFGSGAQPVAVRVSGDRVFLATNVQSEDPVGHWDINFAAASLGGEWLWSTTYVHPFPGGAYSSARTLAVDLEGNLVAGGYASTTGFLVKVHRNGALLWRADTQLDGYEESRSLLVDHENNTVGVFLNSLTIDGQERRRAFVEKRGPGGGLLWASLYELPGANLGRLRPFKFSPDGMIYGLCSISRPDLPFSTAVLRVDHLGQIVVVDEVNTADSPVLRAVDIDSYGSIYAAGSRREQPNLEDYLTVKLSGPARNIAPSSFNLFRGALVSGTVQDLHESDDARLVFKAGPVLQRSEPPTQIIVSGTAHNAFPGSLKLRIEGGPSAPGFARTVQCFNFKTGTFETVATGGVPQGDSILELDLSGDLARFVSPGSLEVRTKIVFTPGPSVPRTWNVGVDQVRWTVR